MLPPTLQVNAFRGGRINDAVRLLESPLYNLENIDSIVLAVGLNDRLSDPDDLVLDLQRLADWANRYHKQIFFLEIPMLPALNPATRDCIRHLNLAARDIFSPDFIDIDQSRVIAQPSDVTGLHYCTETAEYMISRVSQHFLA